ncbi:MAG: TerC family protein [Armatimonadota bacterium]|nr:TerC family protein [Armatimonadota bacterium]MDR7450544.1 TerC family protein [Armatimonadota bacterium]MDR7466323.1 TerC family protein [Armatimonadota bacterium]MDR7493044.1 TerC family protein [Armatimonadota bacterium]MDR7498199.1 TerC family protein [Armatimonadota bacterium]
MSSIGTPLLWAAFLLFVAAMLALDLGVFHRRAHTIRPREALGWSIFWIVLALVFAVGMWRWFGPQRGLEFLTGYLIEKALSVDNIFVFLVIFSYFGVPTAYQHRVLFWGIVGAVVFRLAFILAGAALLAAFHWIIYVFGGLLIVTGLRMLRSGEEVHPERNRLVGLARRLLPVVPRYHGAAFFVREGGRRAATPLMIALLTVEATDIVFAVDSIPAIFAITTDPFIVFTSNLFAILGLRALYFLLAGLLHRFHYLKVGLSLVLVFVGLKMLISPVLRIPIVLSLGVVALLIGVSVAASLLRRPPLPGPVPVGEPSAAPSSSWTPQDPVG